MNTLKLLFTNLFGGLSAYVVPIVGGVCFCTGLYISHVWHGYQETKQLQAIQDNIVAQGKINNQIVEDLQNRNSAITANYRTLLEKANEIQVVNHKCQLTIASGLLWNQSGGTSESVPSDTTGSSSPSGTGHPSSNSVEGVGIDLRDILKNKIENDEIHKRNNARHQAILDWNYKTYGKR